MKKYATFIKIEVKAETEDEAINKMYELMSLGEVKIDSIDVLEVK